MDSFLNSSQSSCGGQSLVGEAMVLAEIPVRLMLLKQGEQLEQRGQRSCCVVGCRWSVLCVKADVLLTQIAGEY